MPFCSNCGNQANEDEKFCTGCGSPIVIKQVSISHNVGEIIKEEYELGQAPPQSDQTSGTHIGDQRRSGEWLESTVENILKFAGFETQREQSFVFNENTGDRFRVDIVARDSEIEIFVECKDYSTIKMDEKIMYTLIGQLADYREKQYKKVIGILVMTAKDEGQNAGIREKLRKDGAFLWDGRFIEHLQNKMSELGNKEDFRKYVLEQLDYSSNTSLIKKDGDFVFMVKYSFYTLPVENYVGRAFDTINIISDLKKRIENTPLRILNHSAEAIKSGSKVYCYYMSVDFGMDRTTKEVEEFAKKKKKRFSIRKQNPYEVARDSFKEACFETLVGTYGVRYNPKGKKDFDKVVCEGSRTDTIKK